MKIVRFGIVGAGLMGREFASAAARWCHLRDAAARPEIVAVCSRGAEGLDWFRRNVPTAKVLTHEYEEVLARPDVDAVYVALPHHLHREVCCAAIEAGKHLMAEKPFGIDRAANAAIVEACRRNPRVFVRCASQWYFYPGVQRIGRLVERDEIGRVLEANTGFLHSSDLDPNKPINRKRQTAYNGEYGVMGDLGMHVCAFPFRAGWRPRDVRAILSKVVTERPGPGGAMVPCETWDNATLLCRAEAGPATFPLEIKLERIAPGQQNTWYLEVLGTKTSARFTTRNPKQVEILRYEGGEQVWGQVEAGYQAAYPTVTGPIFEFGFADAVLQMWAAFLHELAGGKPPHRFAGCVTPEETVWSHALFTAALTSQSRNSVEECRDHQA